MDFSDPSWRVATGGVKHGNFVTFGEAFVKLISWQSGRIYLKEEGGSLKEEKCWILDSGFWVNFRQEDRIYRMNGILNVRF